MRLRELFKRVFRGPRSVESVAAELAEGLRNGTIYLDHIGPEGGNAQAAPNSSINHTSPGTANGGVIHESEPSATRSP